jgi:hypothetical protein
MLVSIKAFTAWRIPAWRRLPPSVRPEEDGGLLGRLGQQANHRHEQGRLR